MALGSLLASLFRFADGRRQVILHDLTDTLQVIVLGLGRGEEEEGRENRPRIRIETVDGSATPEGLARVVQTNGLSRSPTTLVLASGSYQLFSTDVPDLPREAWSDALRWQVQDYLEGPASEMILELLDLPPSRLPHRKQQVYVAAAREGPIGRLAQWVIRSGLRLQTITIPELPLLALAARLPEQENGLALLYLNRKEGKILVIRQQTLQLARPITNSRALQAEAIPLSSPASQDEVALQVRRTLDYHESTFDQRPLMVLYVLSSEPSLPGLIPALGDRLNLPVKRVDVRRMFQIPDSLSEADLSLALPALGAAFSTTPPPFSRKSRGKSRDFSDDSPSPPRLMVADKNREAS